jgi:subtilase family serine protease
MLKTSIAATATAVALTCAAYSPALSAEPSGLVQFGSVRAKPVRVVPGLGTIVIPDSSIARPEDLGRRAHTHHRVLIPNTPVEPPPVGTAISGAVAPLLSVSETPASLACVYRLVAQTFGCDPTKAKTVAKGGSKAIAIVDAYHNKTALKDLQTFSTHFGLPAPKLTVVYCSATSCTGVTTPPPANQGWAAEIALDLDAAHAMAPNAHLYLVEAHSNSYVDLLRAEDRAAQLVAAAGGGQVSNSWGGGDFNGEQSMDLHFVKAKVVFFASTGDHKSGTNSPDVEWPSVSPNVVAVGGTTIIRNNASAYLKQSAWTDGGGGLSQFELRPAYQTVVATRVGKHRGAPDIAADADPASGMWIYCAKATCGYGSAWLVFGGTSLAAPLVAGIANNAGHFRASSIAELTAIYKELGGALLSDVTSGHCGNGTNGAFVNAISGWDRCTGVGTPKVKGAL